MLKIANIVSLCFFIMVLCIAGCIQFDESEERYEDTRNKMDTFVSIIVYSSDEVRRMRQLKLHITGLMKL